MPTNNDQHKTGPPTTDAGDGLQHPASGPDSVQLGYETRDVNVGGVAVFLAGLFGFVLIFFAFCYFMGRTINTALEQQDGPNDKWHKTDDMFSGARGNGGNLENLKSNAAMEQQQLSQMTASFPRPRLETDDGNQDVADLHAREDLLLNHYSTVPGEQGIRIPIDRAMQLIAQRGLPVATPAAPGEQLAHDQKPAITLPLTSGFARTGYELDQIEARQQKMNYGKAESLTNVELHRPQ